MIEKQVERIIGLFEEDFFTILFEEHDYIERIDFFGSHIKGTNHEASDIDIIIIPNAEKRKEMKEDDNVGVESVINLHQDFRDGLINEQLLDVKIQEFQNEKEEYGWSYHSNDWVASFYSFIKGEVGTVVSLLTTGEINVSER